MTAVETRPRRRSRRTPPRRFRRTPAALGAIFILLLLAALDQLKNDNAQREYYLTDVPALIQAAGGAVKVCRAALGEQILGVNTPEQLALTERCLRQRAQDGA